MQWVTKKTGPPALLLNDASELRKAATSKPVYLLGFFSQLEVSLTFADVVFQIGHTGGISADMHAQTGARCKLGCSSAVMLNLGTVENRAACNSGLSRSCYQRTTCTHLSAGSTLLWLHRVSRCCWQTSACKADQTMLPLEHTPLLVRGLFPGLGVRGLHLTGTGHR